MSFDSPIINEYTIQQRLSHEHMDAAWANGWRHFGSYFFRYSRSGIDENSHHVIPLRIRLDQFKLSKSQKRIVSKNRDVQIVVRDAVRDQQKIDLFERHKRRFTDNVPDDLTNFTGDAPATVPCETKEICLFKDDRLIAASFWDIGHISTSSLYAMFEPDESKRSLGIYLIVLSILFSIQNNKIFYYPGYAHRESSFYDYKKKLNALYYFNWRGDWLPLDTS